MYLTVITKFFVINLKLHVVPLVTIWNKDSTYSYFQHGYFSLYTLVEDFLPKKFCHNKYNLLCYNSLILNSSTDIETIWAGIVLLENEILIHVLYSIPEEKYSQILRTSSFIDFVFFIVYLQSIMSILHDINPDAEFN